MPLYDLSLREGLDETYAATGSFLADLTEEEVARLEGADVWVSIARGEITRSLAGTVTQVERATDTRKATVEIVPALARIDARPRRRVFEYRCAVEIIRDVLEAALAPLGRSVEVAAAPRALRPITVQHGESDAALVFRLAREEGLQIEYRHEPDGERLVIVEADDAPRLDTLTLGATEMRDDALIVFEGPVEERWLYRGASRVAGFRPGARFHLASSTEDRNAADVDAGDYVLSNVTHRWHRGRGGYINTFECVEGGDLAAYDARARIGQAAPASLEHAEIVAVETDLPGDASALRVRVRFAWAETAHGDDRECWLSLGEAWDSPAGWGASFTPEVGTKVLVELAAGRREPRVIGCLPGAASSRPALAEWPGEPVYLPFGGVHPADFEAPRESDIREIVRPRREVDTETETPRAKRRRR